MYFIRGNAETAPRQALVLMTLPDIYDIFLNVSGNDEDRILVTSDIQPLSLPYSVELSPFMTADYGSVRIWLITGFADMSLS